LPERLVGLRLSAPLQPIAPPVDLSSGTAAEFRAADGRSLTAFDPPLKAALLVLGESWPQSLPWEDFWAALQARLGASPDAAPLMAGLVQSHEATGLVELHVLPPPGRLDASEKPTASPLARYQAARGGRVTNLRHEVIELNEFNRHLLRLLDGSRDRAALGAGLEERIDRGGLAYRHHGQPLTDPQELRQLLPTLLEKHLAWLARSSLLID
jgi:hypothetical protein